MPHARGWRALTRNSLAFVDENGANPSLPRPHGLAPADERGPGSAPGHWYTVTLIRGMRLSGVTASLVIEGTMDTALFASYVE
ncbi:hypothetical protein V5E97_35805 [Singulisphaera sp. Ch08]|uniref:Transposase n=1 Tax=Singulisphaera sp. Ch08 TaxID=3120278 RepID=A0AAU7CFC5_9BACT